MTAANKCPSLLEVRNLTLRYHGISGPTAIVRDVSFELGHGEVLGIIGESGAGKSTIGNAVIGLLGAGFEQSSGTIRLNGIATEALNAEERHALRDRTIASIFQDRTSSLDPLMTVGGQLTETISAIFISHDLAVVQDICDTACVIKDGQVADHGPSAACQRSLILRRWRACDGSAHQPA